MTDKIISTQTLTQQCTMEVMKRKHFGAAQRPLDKSCCFPARSLGGRGVSRIPLKNWGGNIQLHSSTALKYGLCQAELNRTPAQHLSRGTSDDMQITCTHQKTNPLTDHGTVIVHSQSMNAVSPVVVQA